MMTTKNLTREDVLHIAKLCNLNLSDIEIESLQDKLAQTIEYIKILEELKTEDTVETFQVTGLTNVFQQDNEKETTLTQDEALANAHEKIKNLFGLKAIFDR